MRIFVCIKQVPDTETKIKLNSDNSAIDESGIKWIVNPYDEFAIEEALKLKTTVGDAKVTAISVGPKKRVTDALRTAMAMGADDGIIIDTDQYLDAHATGKALATAIKKQESYDFVFTGKLAIDGNASSVSQYLAEFLDIPHVTVVSGFKAEDGKYTMEREVEGGTKEIFEVNGPAVLGANKGLNTPRYASLPGIMKAKKKPLEEFALSDLGFEETDIKVSFSNFEMPEEKPPVKFIEGDPAQQAQELVRLLKDEAKVL
jgi:electron transfer flavoprotein beta subunit